MTIPLIRYPEFRPYSNIQPFTVQDGATYALQIETLLAWIKRDLVPHIDTEIAALTANWDETALELISGWEQMSADLIARVEAAEAALGNAVTEAQAAKVAAEAARDLAAIYSSQAEEIQDTAITSIFSNAESAFRVAADDVYASKTSVQDVVTALDSVNTSITEVQGELTGRLSAGSIVAEIDKRTSSVMLASRVENAGDVTGSIQALIDSMSPGDSLTVDAVSWQLNGTLTIPHDDFTLNFVDGATVDRSNAIPGASAIVVTGDRVTINGAGNIISPEWWDGTNNQWTYAVILFSGCDSPTVNDIRLTNVNRVGIGFKDTTGAAKVHNVTIDGNFPSSNWTELNTVHFGVGFDPGVMGSLKVSNSIIRSSVQGVCLGNYGLGITKNADISGNLFEGCHNHAIYNAGNSDGMTVVGNTVVDCSRAIAMTGNNHVVSNNLILAIGQGSNIRMVASIHMRNANGCIVSNNRIKGDAFPGIAVIDFSAVSGYAGSFNDNVCEHNTVEVTNAVEAIGIRLAGAVDGFICTGNIITAQGRVNQGVITLIGADGSARNIKVQDNIVRIRGKSNGIFMNLISDADIKNNTINLEYDDSVATVLGGIMLNGASGVKVVGNTFRVPAEFGANISLRAIYEIGTTVGNYYSDSRFNVDMTKLTALVKFLIITTSASVINEVQEGAPTMVCGKGSTWRRTDGGAGTTFYIKESEAVSNIWRAL